MPVLSVTFSKVRRRSLKPLKVEVMVLSSAKLCKLNFVGIEVISVNASVEWISRMRIQFFFWPLVIQHDESEPLLGATIDQLTDELRENFVNVPFDEENSEWEQSNNEDDVDSERNIFDDIMIDGEWIDNRGSTL